LRRIPGALPAMKRMPSWPLAMNAAAKAFLPGLLLLVATRGALAESASQAPPQSPPWTATESSPTPTGPATFPQNALTASAPVDFPPSVPPAATRPAPLGSRPGPLHAAIIPALETRVGFSTLSRVSSSNNRVLYKGLRDQAIHRPRWRAVEMQSA